MGKIKLLLVDDHSILRAGLRLLLNSQPDMEVVGEAGDGVEALRLAEETRPDVVIMDLTMPGEGGIEATRRIRQAVPEAKVLVLTMHDDGAYLRAALAAGAAGFVVKQAADTELLSAIRAVSSGRTVVFSGLTCDPAELLGRPDGGSREGLALLSEREKEVLRLLALGYTNHEIAELLFISVKTVESHKSRIMEKLGCTRRVDLVRFALEHGLISLAST